MKTRTLATVVILICSFVLAPNVLRAEENEWYQGQQGEWHQKGHNWRWESTHGDDWYQGRQGTLVPRAKRLAMVRQRRR